MSRLSIIAGNWKLHPPRTAGEELFAGILRGLEERRPLPSQLKVLICPPHPYLGLLSARGELLLGAQDLSAESWGAFTGEVGGPLLQEFGALYAIVGHSERRHILGEGDTLVGRKTAAAVAAGLTPILCVGETLPEREAGETFAVVERQLHAGLEDLLEPPPQLVIAYEPVWAIGTGRTATPEIAAEVHRMIRGRLRERWGSEVAQSTPILYGGSVKPENATDLLGEESIDGALVGGASLEAKSFLGIVDVALEMARN